VLRIEFEAPNWLRLMQLAAARRCAVWCVESRLPRAWLSLCSWLSQCLRVTLGLRERIVLAETMLAATDELSLGPLTRLPALNCVGAWMRSLSRNLLRCGMLSRMILGTRRLKWSLNVLVLSRLILRKDLMSASSICSLGSLETILGRRRLTDILLHLPEECRVCCGCNIARTLSSCFELSLRQVRRCTLSRPRLVRRSSHDLDDEGSVQWQRERGRVSRAGLWFKVKERNSQLRKGRIYDVEGSHVQRFTHPGNDQYGQTLPSLVTSSQAVPKNTKCGRRGEQVMIRIRFFGVERQVHHSHCICSHVNLSKPSPASISQVSDKPLAA
jgi:hypothetical protein